MNCLLKTSDTTPRISWIHNDPESDAQAGYQVQIDRSPLFNSNNGNPDYDSGNVSSANAYHDVLPALTITGKLYVRVRTRDATHAIGEGAWAEGFIILDPSIDSVNGEPLMLFTIPTDPDNDNLHFRVQICLTGDFTSPVLNKYSGSSQVGWEYKPVDAWIAIPAGGIPSSAYGKQARYTVQESDALANEQIHAFRIQAEGLANLTSDYAYALMDVGLNEPPNAPTNLSVSSI